MPDRVPTPMSLEQRLRALGDRDDLFPATPDIATDVAALTRSQESIPQVRRFGQRPARWLRLAAIMALLLLLLAALVVALAVPTSRTAIADFLGIEGIRVEVGDDGDDVPTGTPSSIGGSLLLGERSTLDRVIATAPFDIVLPADVVAGEPDEVYLNRRSKAVVVGLLYEASDTLPEIGSTRVGMLLLEIDSPNGDVFFIKKTVAGGGELTMASVNGSPAYWIEDGILSVAPIDGLMLDPPGTDSRRSGNVLIWSNGDVTYRLETDVPMSDAVRIAESFTPVDASGNQASRRGV